MSHSRLPPPGVQGMTSIRGKRVLRYFNRVTVLTFLRAGWLARFGRRRLALILWSGRLGRASLIRGLRGRRLCRLSLVLPTPRQRGIEDSLGWIIGPNIGHVNGFSPAFPHARVRPHAIAGEAGEGILWGAST